MQNLKQDLRDIFEASDHATGAMALKLYTNSLETPK